MRDFVKELQERSKKIDRRDFKESEKPTPYRLFNVHKRSLPPGFDLVVLIGVTKAEGEWWIEKILKSKVYTDDSRDTKTLVYFDLIPQGATPKEQSIYFNLGGITK
jgi:hypothetical protein